MKKIFLIGLLFISIDCFSQHDTTQWVDARTVNWGQYKDKKLVEVPAQYLLEVYDRGLIPAKYIGLRKYIESRLTQLRQTVSN